MFLTLYLTPAQPEKTNELMQISEYFRFLNRPNSVPWRCYLYVYTALSNKNELFRGQFSSIKTVAKTGKDESNMATDVRKDIFQTSTGVGHHYRPGYYFPSSNFRVSRNDCF